MSDLDEKLVEVLSHKNWVHRTDPRMSRAVAEVKQAFKDAGYILPGETLYAMPKGKDLARELAGLSVDDGVNITELASPMMTGEEWYDRFEKELPEPYRTNLELNPHGHETPNGKYASQGEKNMHSKALFAARKASGLE